MSALLSCLLLLIISTHSFSQCCSANPVAGSVNIGVLSKKTIRTITYYRYSFSDRYIEGSKPSGFNGVSKSYYNFIGEIAAYGITGRLTVETELGYYINRSEVLNTMPPITQKGYGMYNGALLMKYGLIKKEEFEWSFSTGGKFPFRKKQLEVESVQLPQTLQPSTGAFGGIAQIFLYRGFPQKGLRLFSISRIEVNQTNIVGYRYGNLYNFSIFVSKSMNLRWTRILQLTSEIRDRDVRDNKRIVNSGGTVFFVSPQINYSITQSWNISMLVNIPAYRHFNGTQLGGGVPFSITLTRDFNIGERVIKSELPGTFD